MCGNKQIPCETIFTIKARCLKGKYLTGRQGSDLYSHFLTDSFLENRLDGNWEGNGGLRWQKSAQKEDEDLIYALAWTSKVKN